MALMSINTQPRKLQSQGQLQKNFPEWKDLTFSPAPALHTAMETPRMALAPSLAAGSDKSKLRKWAVNYKAMQVVDENSELTYTYL